MAEGTRMTLLGDDSAAHVAAINAAADRDPEADRDNDDDLIRKKQIVERCIKRFTLAASAEYDQRQREDEDLRFDRALPADQWPSEIRTARAGGIGPDGFQVTERPCLVINKLDQPIQQVINEARNARLGVHIKPKSDGASQDGAEVRQGLYRAIEMDSRAHIARLWALDRAVKCGRGAYRIVKKYANDGDFDLDLVIERILNQASVYLDPFAKEPDWSDGEWAIITSDIPEEEYKRLYPKSRVSGMSSEQLESIGNKVPGWIGATDENGGRTIRIAEYFHVEHTDRTLVFLNGQKLFLDELPANTPLPPGTKTRTVDVRQVKWCVVNCEEVLEEEDWEGRYIPIVPVIGKEYNVNGDRCFKGVISNSKDAQRSYNYMRSAQVEAVGLAPKAPYIMAEGQDEGYEAMWDQLNTRNYTRLKYKPVDLNGEVLGAPQRNVAEPAIQAISMAVNMADTDIKSTTGRFDPSLGRSRADQSGKAIMALKESGESTTSNYLENLTAISMHHEARIILDLMPYVYDRPGRIIRVLGEEDDQDKTVMINAPFVQGPNGQPMPAPPPGMMERLQQMPGGKPPRPPKVYDLRQGQYSVEITVGRSFATQRDENAEMLRSIIEAAPGLTPMLADLLVEQIDTPIAKRAAARLRKSIPQAQDDEDAPPIPPELQAELEGLKQQNQQLQQALQEQNFEIQANRYKVDADAQVKQAEIAARVEIARLQAQTGVQTTGMKGQTDVQVTAMKIRADQQEQQDEQAHERGMSAIEVRASREERAEGQAHERDMKRGAAQTEMLAQSREHDADRERRGEDRAFDHEQKERDRAHGTAETTRQREYDRTQTERERAFTTVEGERERRASSAESARDRKTSATEADKDRAAAAKQAQLKAKTPPNQGKQP